MSQKYRVMMICHYDDTNASGGLEAQARLLSRTLRSTGENVIVLGSTRRLSRARWSDDHGVPVRLFWTYASPQVSGRYLPASIIWAFQLLVWIALNRSKIEVLHCHQIRIHAFVSARCPTSGSGSFPTGCRFLAKPRPSRIPPGTAVACSWVGWRPTRTCRP
jgi:hypothetical protein